MPRFCTEEDHERLTMRIRALETALQECAGYFDDRSDVVDGDYGVPAPNKEMKMLQMIQEAL